MKTRLPCFAPLTMRCGIAFFALSAANVGKAAFVYFDGSTSTDFNTASNWDSDAVPDANSNDTASIDDGLSATFAAGSVTVAGLRVGSADKLHAAGENHFGRLTMTGGELHVNGVNTLAIGREKLTSYFPPVQADYTRDTLVDGADLLLWQRDLGSTSKFDADGDDSQAVDAGDLAVWEGSYGRQAAGGELVVTGDATLRSNGALVGERSRGLLSIGPDATVEIRIWDGDQTPVPFGGAEDLRVGTWGPAYETFGAEPGLDGNGLVEVFGTLSAKDLYLSEHGAKGALRIVGGTVNLNGELIMDRCDGCTSDPVLLATQSATVFVDGSGGAFNIGLDPDPLVVDPTPPPRSLLAATPTAKFSFKADAGGVTTINVADNVGETSGTANINTAKLEVDLTGYTSTAPLKLIDAPANKLVGTFGTVTFIGNRVGEIHYDVANGDVYLDSFHLGASSAGPAPEPSAFLLALTATGFFAVKRKPRNS